MTCRKTIVVHGRLAMRQARLEAARGRAHGTRILAFEHLAARLAGGFSQPIDRETLRAAVQEALPETELGALDDIKSLPGMVRAAVDTLNKAWRAGIDLSARAGDHPRLAAIAALEQAVLERLPPSMFRPCDLVLTALTRLQHAPAIFGAVEIRGLTELSPCWRPLLFGLAERMPVTWNAGPREVPSWLAGSAVKIEHSEPQQPNPTAVSCANAHHEVVEALRWARELLASGRARPAEVAIAAASTAEYDDHVLTLRADANLNLRFVHGVSALATREGQAAAALADILVRGLSQNRIRRLNALLHGTGPFSKLPEGWTRSLPSDAPLASLESWQKLLGRMTIESWPELKDGGPALLAILELLDRGVVAAADAGEQLLSGRSLSLWRTALQMGPAEAIDSTLASLRLDDSQEACVSMAWMPAADLAACPRRFVRLLGLTSRGWPRSILEDRLLPDHVIPLCELDPLPVATADRRDFRTILVTTAEEIVFSRPRRDSEGRKLGKSPLLPRSVQEQYVRQARIPEHAMSEADRLLARLEEFRGSVQARSAAECWRDWRRDEVTPHDGLVRASHPIIIRILERTQSATSLSRLLRDPLGFVWTYALGMKAPQSGTEPLTLDNLQFGQLLHEVLERAVLRLEEGAGFGPASVEEIGEAVRIAMEEAAHQWEAEGPVPPLIIWRRTLQEAARLASSALTFDVEALPGQSSWAEVPFGGYENGDGRPRLPWDPMAPVEIHDRGLKIRGSIDRLDLSADGATARVWDYKSGQVPKGTFVLNGGGELQRCLYTVAVKALLGQQTAVEASLLYPRQGQALSLADPEGVIAELAGHLVAARDSLMAGNALPGPGAETSWNELALALPANAVATYCKRKKPATAIAVGPASQVWEAE